MSDLSEALGRVGVLTSFPVVTETSNLEGPVQPFYYDNYTDFNFAERGAFPDSKWVAETQDLAQLVIFFFLFCLFVIIFF